MQGRIAFQSQTPVHWVACGAFAAGLGSDSEFDIDPETAYCPAAVLGTAVDPQVGGSYGQ